MGEAKVYFTKVVKMCAKYVKGLFSKIMFYIKSWFRDEWYYPISIDELHTYLEIWVKEELPKLAYSKETFDCDDFGAYFKAWLTLVSGKNCVGEAVGILEAPSGEWGKHEWNIVLVRGYDGKDHIFMVEPQIGEVFLPVEEKHTSDGFKYHLKWVIW